MKRGTFIVRPVPGGGHLLNYEALWAHSGRRAMSTIRKHCEPLACDVETRQLLFDAESATASLANVKARQPHRRPGARVRS